MAEMPRPVAHLHSNGEFCQDLHVVSDEWPVYLWTAEQVEELLRQAEIRAVAGAYEDSTLIAFRAAYCK